jgi:MscS family membrane protein
VRRLEYWQMLALLFVIPSALLLGRTIANFIGGLEQSVHGRPRVFIWALTILFSVAIIQFAPPLLGLPERQRSHASPIIGSLVLLSAGVAAWHLCSILGRFLSRRAQLTSGEIDDILVNFFLTAVRAVIAFSTGISIAHLLSIPTQNILAALGIGGFAFAIAARDTLSNIFGAGILVTDRPFRSGDWINAGFVEGSVEAVGIRSTRIRTAHDSVSIVPNGKLADATINNLGTRRHRVIKMNILVTDGATSQKLQAYIDSLEQRVAGNAAFVSELTEIGIADIGKDGVTLAFTGHLNVSTDRAESVARHALLVDLMNLAHEHRIRLGYGMDNSKFTP